MKVIGAGFGRTGTLSLKHALELLGFGPCYHMVTVIQTPEHAALWQQIVDGQAMPWQRIFGDFEATVDLPGCLYYKELMTQYPEAKVILSVRDPERWYDSLMNSVYQIHTLPQWMRWLPNLGERFRLLDEMIWNEPGFFEGRVTDKQFAINAFNQHNESVKQTVPPEKLLVFNVKEGWEPLCQFLGVPVPDEPFPHLNDRAEMQQRIRGLKTFGKVMPAIAVTLVMVILGYWLGRKKATEE